MDKSKLADKLWDLANLVTGFAVAQSLVVTFALAKNEWKDSLKGPAPHWIAIISTLVFTIFYVTAIVWCGSKTRSLSPPAPDHSDLISAVTCGRVVAVILFTLIVLGTLWGHWRNQ